MPNRCPPPELLDEIVNFLYYSRDTLKSCCLVSKSWIPRSRTHLFACISFRTVEGVESWKTTFPDPSTSPARYTRTLLIECPWAVTAAATEEGGWIQTFSCVVHLEMDLGRANSGDLANPCLVPFHGFSPVVKSLHLSHIPLPLPPIFYLISSFPLLENLSLLTHVGISSNDGSDRQVATTQPLSTPVFTGSLRVDRVNHVITQLLSMPGGLHFRKLDLSWIDENDIPSTTSLVKSCRSTIEFLRVDSCIHGMSSRRLHPSDG